MWTNNSAPPSQARFGLSHFSKPSPLGGEGIPFVFDTFTLEGYVPSLDFLDTGAAWIAPKSARPDVRARELPTENAVVAFR